MSKVLKPGEKEAKDAARKQQALLREQQKKDQLEAAEEDDEVKRRKAIADRGGNRSLLNTTGEQGLAKTLGG